MKSFVHEMSNLLSLLQQTNKLVYIMGDYNINLLNVHTHIFTADFTDMMYSYLFFPLITKPTRVAGNTATLTDNIFCNDVDCLDMMNGIFYNDISDHFPIFSINFKGYIADKKQYITKRMLTTKNISSFQDRLASADRNNIMSCSECQQGYSMFYKKYIKMCSNCFPVKTFSVEQKYRNRKLWLTDGMKNSIKYKRRLYIKYKEEPNSYNEKTYTVF